MLYIVVQKICIRDIVVLYARQQRIKKIIQRTDKMSVKELIDCQRFNGKKWTDVRYAVSRELANTPGYCYIWLYKAKKMIGYSREIWAMAQGRRTSARRVY